MAKSVCVNVGASRPLLQNISVGLMCSGLTSRAIEAGEAK